jgi:hypothetical protein
LKLETPSKPVKRIGKHMVHEYNYGGKDFCVLSKIKRGPNKLRVTKVEDESGNDVTVEMKAFMGPNEDWHRIPYTLEDFGREKLCFTLDDGETSIVESRTTILPIF